MGGGGGKKATRCSRKRSTLVRIEREALGTSPRSPIHLLYIRFPRCVPLATGCSTGRGAVTHRRTALDAPECSATIDPSFRPFGSRLCAVHQGDDDTVRLAFIPVLLMMLCKVVAGSRYC